MLMKDAISLMGKSKSAFRLATNKMYRPPSEPSCQEEFEHIMMNFIYDQEERIRQLENYMQDITDEFMEFYLEVALRVKERIKESETKSTRGHASSSHNETMEEKVRKFILFDNEDHQMNYNTLAGCFIHSGDIMDWEFLSNKVLARSFFDSINTDPFSGPQWANLFQINEPIFRELTREFFASFELDATPCRWGVDMELNEGECCWPTTRGVSGEGRGDDEEGDEERGNDGIGGSAGITAASEYGVSTSIGYGVSNFLSNTAYSFKQINTAYPLPLDTAYRSSGTETEILCMTRSSTNELFTPYKEPEREFRSSRKHFKTLSLDELRSPDFNLLSDQEYSEEEEVEAMAETMEQYMSKTRTDYGSGVARPKIDNKDQFELKGQFLKELRENTFSGSDNEDANEHIEKVLEIVDLFHVPNITEDQLMLRVFPISLTGAASRWLRNEPTGSIKTWEDLKTKFLNKYCPPGRTAKKMEEINNFQQEPDETLYQAWERFKELLMKCP
ncbi:hypothetical protein Tco_0408322 [Tanacetum coccineum]